MCHLIYIIFLQVDSCWEFIGLLPFRDDLRSDSVDAIDSLINFGLDIRILTDYSTIQLSCFSYCHFLLYIVLQQTVHFLSSESPLLTTKQVCGKLGKLGINVLPAHSVFELPRNNREVHLNINGISDLFPGLFLSLERCPFFTLLLSPLPKEIFGGSFCLC